MYFISNFLKIDCYDRMNLWYCYFFYKKFLTFNIRFILKNILSLYDFRISFIYYFIEFFFNLKLKLNFKLIHKNLIWQYKFLIKKNLDNCLIFIEYILLNFYKKNLSKMWFYKYKKNNVIIKFIFFTKILSFSYLKNKKDIIEIKYDSKYLNNLYNFIYIYY